MKVTAIETALWDLAGKCYGAPIALLQGGKKIADRCELHSIPLCPHNTSTPVDTLAEAQACAAIPNFIALEFHSIDEPRWPEFSRGDWPIIKDGYITIPEAPGLGVELNDPFVKEFTIEASAGFFEG